MPCRARCQNGSQKMSRSNSASREGPRPETFPIGTTESRAAARAMLTARERESERVVVEIVWLGLGCRAEYAADETGMRKTAGREPTMEDFVAHPALQHCNIEALRGKA